MVGALSRPEELRNRKKQFALRIISSGREFIIASPESVEV
jgi:hypothetical protein